MSTFGVQDLVVYFGKVAAAAGVSFEVGPGEVIALVGGDGSGKSSVLRALAGTVPASSGRVTRPDARAIGYVPGDSGIYRDLTAEENLSFAGRAYGLKGSRLAERIDLLLEATGLAAARDRVTAALSGGMRQKLALAAAMVHEPQLLMLDEPTTGVDPVSRADLWRGIAGAAAAGTAVVFATTYLDEAERADYVVALDGGRVLVEGAPEAILGSVPGRIHEVSTRPHEGLAYRRGAAFRVWDPDGSGGATSIAIDLHDAVIVAALRARTQGSAA